MAKEWVEIDWKEKSSDDCCVSGDWEKQVRLSLPDALVGLFKLGQDTEISIRGEVVELSAGNDDRPAKLVLQISAVQKPETKDDMAKYAESLMED